MCAVAPDEGTAMDRRQLLDRIGALSVVGGLADDVVLACAEVQRSGLQPQGRATLNEALALVRSLSMLEEPQVLSPESLDCMTPTSTVNDTVEHINPGSPEAAPRDALQRVAEDLASILGDSREQDALARVQEFFARLAEGILESSETLIRPHVREASWMPGTPSF